MGKIDIQICCGINCLVRGGQELLNMIENDPTLEHTCGLECVKCLEHCEDGDKSPVVKINGKIYTNFTPEQFMSLLSEFCEN